MFDQDPSLESKSSNDTISSGTHELGTALGDMVGTALSLGAALGDELGETL